MHVTLLLDRREDGTLGWAWNGKPIAIEDPDGLWSSASALYVEARYAPGGLADVQVQGVTSDPRASLIEGLLARGNEDEALAELDRIDERIVARMSGLAGLRARARSGEGDAARQARLEAVLAQAGGDAYALGQVADEVAKHPGPAAAAVMERLLAALEAASDDEPFMALRPLLPSGFTRETLLAAATRLAPRSRDLPWIIEEVVERARALGATTAELTAAFGATLLARLEAGAAAERTRRARSANHLARCRELAAGAGAVPALIGLLESIAGEPDQGLLAAIERQQYELYGGDLDDLRPDLTIEAGPPAPPDAIELLQRRAGGRLPVDLIALFQRHDGIAFGWQGPRLLTVREALDGIALAHEQVGREDDSLLIPLADDGYGMWHALDLDRSGGAAIVELDEGEARPVAASFTAWLAELVGHGVHLPGHGWADESERQAE